MAQVDEVKLASLTEAKLNYSNIMNGSGDFKGALGMLTDGRLAVVAAVAAPGGDEKNRPGGGIKSRKFAVTSTRSCCVHTWGCKISRRHGRP